MNRYNIYLITFILLLSLPLVAVLSITTAQDDITENPSDISSKFALFDLSLTLKHILEDFLGFIPLSDMMEDKRLFYSYKYLHAQLK